MSQNLATLQKLESSIFLGALACLMDCPNPSIMNMKRKGESGSPCLSPLEERKISEGEPLIKIEKLEEVTRAMTHLI